MKSTSLTYTIKNSPLCAEKTPSSREAKYFSQIPMQFRLFNKYQEGQNRYTVKEN